MVPEDSPAVRRLTFAMLALAAWGVEIAAVDTRPTLISLGLASVWVVLAALVAWRLPRPADPHRRPPIWVHLLILVLGVAPFIVDPLQQRWLGDGYALELQMVLALRNMGLGLAACAGWVLCLRLAAVASLFLMLFAAAMTNHPAVMAFLGLYTLTGGAWLMLLYWAGLRDVLIARERMVRVQVLTERQRLPWGVLAALVLALVGGGTLAVVGPQRMAVALGEWLPTSGGSGETDPLARHGIGDGPEEVAGDNARSAGMVEGTKAIEDNKNALIDVVNDMYGPPHRPPKDQDRMVAGGRMEVIQNHGKLPENRRPSRDFDTSRKGPKLAHQPPTSRGARGLFEIQGRTPLHIRLVVYERYDAADRRWREARKPVSRMLEAEERDWMRLLFFREAADWYANNDRHKLKVADLNDNLVPTPTMLTRVRIDQVNRVDYYDWAYEGVLTLAGRRRTPPGVIVTTECRTLDPAKVPGNAFALAGPAGGTSPDVGDVPEPLRQPIAALAREWAGDAARGGAQVEAIRARLRRDYVHDRSAVPPADHPAPVLWFLNESRRGPDYLFATAAVMLLRALDYPTRLCLGYYAHPDAYDSETAHTPVRADDLHFWAEVRLRDGHWLVVEATPGYATLPPRVPWVERFRTALFDLGRWAWRHLVEVIAVVGLGILVWGRRRPIADAVMWRWWLWRPGRTWREQIRGAVRLLERRARWAGRPRPVSRTIPAWLSETVSGRDNGAFGQLPSMAAWSLYAPDMPPPWSDQEVFRVSRAAVAAWTLGRWRAAERSPRRDSTRRQAPEVAS
ncbi:MAG: transglutaminase-like domain-containing protein [Gemmataceae bacterium]|nr:transglutaminase-like domain-containing protein [Gemmataceae bacterium]MDW8265709.1 transglutaminase-like domain-containing protein [Gemmataceae bacterium]